NGGEFGTILAFFSPRKLCAYQDLEISLYVRRRRNGTAIHISDEEFEPVAFRYSCWMPGARRRISQGNRGTEYPDLGIPDHQFVQCGHAAAAMALRAGPAARRSA